MKLTDKASECFRWLGFVEQSLINSLSGLATGRTLDNEGIGGVPKG